MISLLITVLVVALVFGICVWIVQLLPIPAPWGNVVLAILGLILLLWIIESIVPLAGHPLLLH